MTTSLALRRLSLLLLLVALAACAKPLPVDKQDYIGHWQGEGVRLVIRADGQASYEKVKESRRTSISGPAHSFTTQGFKIGIGPLSASFRVASPPTQTQGVWRMIVDGVELTRRDLGDVPENDGPSVGV